MLSWLTHICLIFVSAIWAVIGLVFWVPFIGRMVAIFVLSVLSSVTHGTNTTNAEKGLLIAISFYMDGFSRIWNVSDTNKKDTQSYAPQEGADISGTSNNNKTSTGNYIQPEGIKLFGNILETLFFWVATLYLLGIIEVPSLVEITNFIVETGPLIVKSILLICVGLGVLYVIKVMVLELAKKDYPTPSSNKKKEDEQ